MNFFEIDLKKFTSYGIGGACKEVYFPENLNELVDVVKKINLEKKEFFVLGNGTNVLFKDENFNKAIINTCNLLHESETKYKINNIKNINASPEISQCDFVYENFQNRISKECVVEVFAGEQLMTVIRSAANFGLSNLEDLAGIPSTIGGAFKMNAGAFKEWFLNYVIEATFVDRQGNVKTLTKDKMNFGYRTQNVLQNNSILYSCKIQFTQKTKEEVNAKIDEIISKRRIKQPLEFGSCGSVFKNIEKKDAPNGKLYAWLLIDELKLRGHSIGGAKISEKHTNFIINFNNAKSQDVRDLIKLVKEKVLEKYGEIIETEVVILD